MKRIAIITSLAGMGGTEISLINLLQELPEYRFDITIFSLGESGALINEVPKWIKVRKIEAHSSKYYFAKYLREHQIGKLIQVAWKQLISMIVGWVYKENTMYQYHLRTSLYEKIDKVYDTAISWALPNSLHTVYTLENVKAKRKAIWIHMDVSVDKQPRDAEKYFVRYDDIFCVSKYCKTTFDKYFPLCKNKTLVFYNIINKKKIIELSKQSENFLYIGHKVILITCSRISGEKQPLMAIEIVEKLVKSGICDFKWFFVGDGPLIEKMKAAIEEKHLGDYLVLLGAKKNPYSYIVQGNLFIQLSRHESYCLTLAEAQLLGIPAVTTNFPSAYEIVDDGRTGNIVNNDVEDMFVAIHTLMKDKNRQEEMKVELAKKCTVPVGNLSQFIKYICE